MECPTCRQKMVKGIRGYPQIEQLRRHMWVAHRLNEFIPLTGKHSWAKFIPAE